MIAELLVREDLNHLLMTDINDLIYSLEREFPEVLKISSIGKTVLNRDIPLLELDARDYLLRNEPELKNEILEKPAILLTGTHHARELVSA